MALSDDIDAHIAAVQDLADDFANQAVTAAGNAQTAAINLLNLFTPPNIQDPKVNVDDKYKPSASGEVVYANDYTQTFNQLKPYLDTLRDEWLNRFFPKGEDCLRELADEWLCSVMAGDYTGIPPEVEEQIWNRARTRITRETSRLERETFTQYARRGFALPPGVANAALLEIRKAALEQSSATSRETAIKAIDVQIETIRFAVQQANALRLGVQNALDGYLRTYMLVPQTAVDKAGQIVSASTNLSNSVAAYYNAVIGAKKLSLEVAIANLNKELKVQDQFVASTSANVDSRVQAALATAQYMANAASGALASLNTLSHIGSFEYT